MIYEMRTYTIVPGKMQTIHKEFAELTHPAFERAGFHVVGYWTEAVGDNDKFHYMLAWNDHAERDAKFATFLADEEWRKGMAELTKDGPLTAQIHNEIWRPTPYSPMQ